MRFEGGHPVKDLLGPSERKIMAAIKHAGP